jgi:PPIC-type PPIASE domain
MSSTLLRVLISLTMFAALPAFSQNQASTTSTTTVAQAATMSPTNTASAANFPISKTVVTIHGLCSDARKASTGGEPKKPGDCVTTLSRQQMETVVKVVEATGRSVLAPQRRDVAMSYVDLMANAAAAEKAGVDKDPRFADVLRLARLKALNDMYQVRLEEEANQVSNAEIKAYYEKNIAGFEELTLSHISVPRYNSANLKDPDFEAKAKKDAYDIRERSAKGEDMDELQKDALETLGIKAPPSTKMAPVRRGVFAKEQEEVLFALKPGEVSKVVEQPGSYIIFKLEKRGTPPLEDVKSEIHGKLSRQKIDSLHAAVAASVHADYNDDYFGPPPPTSWVHMGDINGSNQKKSVPKK